MTLEPYNREVQVVEGIIVNDDEPLMEEEYFAIRSAAKNRRDRLVIQLLYGTGLRVSELLAATPAHLKQDGPDTFVNVRRGKKGGKVKWEMVPLQRELAMDLVDYLRYEGRQPSQRIFGPLTRQGVWYFVGQASIRAIGRRISPHALRGLFCVTQLDLGTPLALVSKMLGHKDEKITLQWYTNLNRRKRAQIAGRMRV